jgi:hypothetical protein
MISSYTSRPSRDIVSTAMQAITQEWWKQAQEKFDLHVSILVIEEAAAGDPEAAVRRLKGI